MFRSGIEDRVNDFLLIEFFVMELRRRGRQRLHHALRRRRRQRLHHVLRRRRRQRLHHVLRRRGRKGLHHVLRRRRRKGFCHRGSGFLHLFMRGDGLLHVGSESFFGFLRRRRCSGADACDTGDDQEGQEFFHNDIPFLVLRLLIFRRNLPCSLDSIIVFSGITSADWQKCLKKTDFFLFLRAGLESFEKTGYLFI